MPRFRGGAALQWQIILGERESGVSIFVPDDGADTGPVVVQRGGVVLSPSETAATLFFEKLQPLGIEALVEATELIAAGRASAQKQDESRATAQGLVDDAVASIRLSAPAHEVDRLARGCDPQPGAFLRLAGKPVRLFEVSLLPASSGAEAGRVVASDEAGVAIALRGGVLRVKRVRADAGKEAASDFARRVGLEIGQRFESGA